MSNLHLPRNSARTVSLAIAYSLRAPLKDSYLPGSLVSNAMGIIPVLLPAREIFSASLGGLASLIRRSIVKFGTPNQVEAFASLWRNAGSSRAMPFFGETGMAFRAYTSWVKGRLWEVDFSAAVVADSAMATSDPLGTGERGRPSYIQTTQLGVKFPDGFFFNKDCQGNHWVSGYMPKGQWGLVEQELAKIGDAATTK
jgi:hypothetical protein